MKDKEPRQRFQSRTQDELETADLLLSLLDARQQWKCLVTPPGSDYCNPNAYVNEIVVGVARVQ